MTITITRNDTDRNDSDRNDSDRNDSDRKDSRTDPAKTLVRARRDAALERLNGGKPRPVKQGLAGRAGGWARGSVARTKPSRRAVQRRVPKPLEQLGPAPAVYYAIVVII